MIVHSVYFVLHDNADAAVQSMIDDGYKDLANLPGITFLAAGTCSDVKRSSSDRDYDVALHVVFQDRPSLDAYLTAPKHVAYMDKYGSNWKRVRVFDSCVRDAAK
jgi:hypothetical protein